MLRDVRSRHAVLDGLGRWWSAPVDYEGQVEYFAKRSLLGLIQVLIGCAVVIIAVVVVVAQFSAEADHAASAKVVAVTFAASLFVVTLAWRPGSWPSLRLSRILVAYIDVGVVAATLTNITGLAGVFALSALVIASFYLVFFDGPKVLLAHTLWIVASMVMIAITLAAEVHGDVALVSARALAGTALGVAPVATQFAIWVLRSDAYDSTTDPLTGLLNRRGLLLHFDDLVWRTEHRTGEVVVVVAIIDLDRFKTINDVFGHAVGDEVLVRSARRLQSAITGALMARVGGEEFVVVRGNDTADAAAMGDELHAALAGYRDDVPVTASIGIVEAPLDRSVHPDGTETVLNELIRRADAAMFAAKRAGGDAVIIHRSGESR